MAAYSGDYAQLAAAYGLTEAQAKAYFDAAYGTGTASSGSGASAEEATAWQSAREQMYAAGVDQTDAYNWLIDNGYSSTEAQNIAADYTGTWLYARGQQDGQNLGVAAQRVLAMINDGIITTEAQALRIIENAAMSDAEKEYLKNLLS